MYLRSHAEVTSCMSTNHLNKLKLPLCDFAQARNWDI